jgi:hypothetical protein
MVVFVHFFNKTSFCHRISDSPVFVPSWLWVLIVLGYRECYSGTPILTYYMHKVTGVTSVETAKVSVYGARYPNAQTCRYCIHFAAVSAFTAGTFVWDKHENRVTDGYLVYVLFTSPKVTWSLHTRMCVIYHVLSHGYFGKEKWIRKGVQLSDGNGWFKYIT